MPNNGLPTLQELYKINKGDSMAQNISAGNTADLSFNDLSSFDKSFTDYSQGTPYSNKDPKDFNIPIYNNEGDEEARAQNQSFLEHAAGALYNTGLELTLGTASMTARAFDLQSHAALLLGAQDNANNAVSEWIDTLKEDINYDVYRTNWSKSFMNGVNPLSSGWWAELLPSLASTLTIALPVGGALKGLEAIGAVSALAKGMSGIKALKGASKIAGGYRNLSAGVMSGITSRAIESLAEGSQAYKETYDELINSGYLPEDASKIASDAAAGTYKKNWLLAASDVMQYSMILNGFSKTGEMLKQTISEGAEEGFQYAASKESQYEALRNANATSEMTALDRYKKYIGDAEFWNSVIAGGGGGALFHYIGERANNDKDPVENKLNQVADDISNKNAAVLAADKKTSLDISDKTMVDMISQSLVENRIKDVEDTISMFKTESREAVEEQGLNYSDYIQKIQKHESLLQSSKEYWDKLNANPNISPDAKVAAVRSMLDTRLKSDRLNQITNEFNQTLVQAATELINQGAQSPELRALKIAEINLKAVESPELIKYKPQYQKAYDDAKKAVPENVNVTTTFDQKLITDRRDILLLGEDISNSKEVYEALIDPTKNGAVEAANKKAEKARINEFKATVKDKILYSKEALEILQNDPLVGEIAKQELEDRDKEEAEAKLLAEKEELDRQAKGAFVNTPSPILPPGPAFTTVEPEKTLEKEIVEYEGKDYEITHDNGKVVGVRPVESDKNIIGPIELVQGIKQAYEEQHKNAASAVTIIKEVKDQLSFQQEPIPTNGDDMGSITIFKEAKDKSNSDNNIYWDNRNLQNIWIANPTELLPGTKIFFKINRSNSYHKENPAEAAIEITDEKGRVVGYVHQNRALDIRALIWNGSSQGITYESTIENKTPGKINNSNVQFSPLEIVPQDRFYLGFGNGNGITVPNKEDNMEVIQKFNMRPGQVTLIAQSNDGKWVPLSMQRRSLNDDEISYLKELFYQVSVQPNISGKDLFNMVNEIMYIGKNVGEDFEHLMLEITGDSVLYNKINPDGSLTLTETPFTQLEEALNDIYRIIENPDTHRNILRELSNVEGVTYKDPASKDNKTYDSYNTFLNDTKVLTGNYVHNHPFQQNALIFFSKDNFKPTQENVNTPITATKIKPKYNIIPGGKRSAVTSNKYVPNDNLNLTQLRKMFPFVRWEQSTVEDIGKILADGGPAAWGAFKDAVIYIAKNAPKGVEYHEAFHAVFDMLLTDRAKAKIYDEARKKYKMPNATLIELEEKLAEELKQYMLGLPTKKTVYEKITDFFKRVYNLFADVINPDDISIDSLFYRTSNGIISVNPRRIRLAKQFQSTLAKRMTIPGMTPEMEADALTYLATELLDLLENRFDRMYQARKEKKPDAQESDYDYLDVFKYYGDVIKSVDKDNTQNVMSAGVTSILNDLILHVVTEQAKTNPSLNLIIEKFELSESEKALGYKGLKDKLIDLLPDYGLGIKAINKQRELIEDVETDKELKDETAAKEGWMSSYGEASIEDYKLGPRLKRFLRTIPSVLDFAEDGTPNVMPSLFGTTKYTDYRAIFNLIKRNVANAKNVDEMISKLNYIGDTTKYKELKLVAYYVENGDLEFRSQFFVGFSNANNLYTALKVTPETEVFNEEFGMEETKPGTVKIIRKNQKTVEKTIIEQWRKLFEALSKDLTSANKNYNASFLEAISKVYNKFPDRAKTVNEGINILMDYFAALGILLDRAALERGFQQDLDGLNSLISNKSGGSIYSFQKDIESNQKNPFNNQKKLFQKIAEVHKNYYPNLGSDNIKRDGVTIHTYANKTFLTKLEEDLKTNIELLKQYSKNSIWAKLMLDNPKYRNLFQIEILSELDTEGRVIKYDEMNPVQDWVQKLLFYHNENKESEAYYNVLTPADNPVMRLVRAPKFSREQVKAYMAEHFAFELKRILEARQFVEKINNETDPNKRQDMLDHLYENYDYKKGDNPLSMTGNAHKLVNFNFPEFNALKDKILKSAVSPESIINIVKADMTSFNAALDKIFKDEAININKELIEYNQRVDSNSPIKFLPDVEKVNTFLMDFAANTWLANIEQSNLFMGDVAFYKSGIDAGKRASQLGSPGEERNDEKSPIIRSIVLKTELLEIVKGAYKGEKVDYTDAQGYAVINEWFNIVRESGRLTKSLARNENKIKDSVQTLPWDSISIQPIKPHYYGRIYDPYRDLNVPTQVKYAIDPLLPAALYKNLSDGTREVINKKLSALNDYMIEHNIQQAFFDSTVKVGLRGRVTWEDIEKNNPPKEKVIELNTRNFKWQQNVPEHHIDNPVLYSTQFRRLLLSGLDLSNEDKVYKIGETMMSAKGVYDLYHNLIVRNVEEDLNNVIDRVRDDDSIIELFNEEVTKRELGQQYEIALQKKDGKLTIPPTMLKGFEFIYNSLFNKVIKQKIRGGQFVQVSAVGNEDLKFVENKDGVIVEAEVMLPWWSRKFFPINADGTLDTSKISQSLLKAVGYRIPTEAKYSMIHFKVKGFLPIESGSKIILPPDVIKQMGSDFDVDKLYVMFYEMKRITDENGNKMIVKDEYEDIETSTKDQRNNKLLDIAIGILSNGNHYDELTASNNYDDLVRLSEEINGKENTQGVFSLPSFQHEARNNYMEGAALIGLGANTNVNHAMTQFTNIKVGNTIMDMVKFKDGDDIPSDTESLSLSNTLNVKKQPIWKLLAQFLASFVDNAKDPLAAKLNINFLTYPIAAVILRTGNTMDSAIHFINQPIIRKISKEWKALGANKAAFKAIVEKYDDLYKDVDRRKIARILSVDQLKKGHGDDITTPFQKAVYERFKSLYESTDAVNNMITALRADSGGVKPNIVDNVNYISRVNGTRVATKVNTQEVFEDVSSYPFVKAFTQVISQSVNNSTRLFPWASPMFETIHSYLRQKKYLKDNEINNVNMDYLMFAHANQPFIKEYSKYIQSLLQHLPKVLNSLIKDSQNLEMSENFRIFANNLFINNLEVHNNLIQLSPGTEWTANERESIINAFRHLYNSNISLGTASDGKPRTSQSVLNALIAYSLFTSGFRKSIGTFNEFIPIDIMDNLGFREYWRDYMDNVDSLDESDAKEFLKVYLRNRKNISFLRAPNPDALSNVKIKDKVVTEFTYTNPLGLDLVMLHNGFVYVLDREGVIQSQEGDLPVGVYVIADWLGQGDIMEYTIDSEFGANKRPVSANKTLPPVVTSNPSANQLSLSQQEELMQEEYMKKLKQISDDEANERRKDCE